MNISDNKQKVISTTLQNHQPASAYYFAENEIIVEKALVLMSRATMELLRV